MWCLGKLKEDNIMIRGKDGFVVLENSDLDKYLDDELEYALYNIIQTIVAGRMHDGLVEDVDYKVEVVSK